MDRGNGKVIITKPENRYMPEPLKEKKDKEAIVQEISFKGNVTEEALQGLHPSQRLLFL